MVCALLDVLREKSAVEVVADCVVHKSLFRLWFGPRLPFEDHIVIPPVGKKRHATNVLIVFVYADGKSIGRVLHMSHTLICCKRAQRIRCPSFPFFHGAAVSSKEQVPGYDTTQVARQNTPWATV